MLLINSLESQISVLEWIASLQELIKPPAQVIVKDRVKVMSTGARKLYHNPQMIKHAILWQMRNFMNPLG